MEKLNLVKIREDIDHIDSEIAKLFEKRMETVNKVAEYKKANKLPVRDKEREAIVLDKCRQRVQNSAYADGLRKIMAQIMDISVEREEKLLEETKVIKPTVLPKGTPIPVGYQGVAGAYSYLAVKKYFSHAADAPDQGINALNAAMLGLMGINALRETFREKIGRASCRERV